MADIMHTSFSGDFHRARPSAVGGKNAVRVAFTRIAVLLALAYVRLNAQPVERIAYDYTSLYERLSPSIVKVEVDSGHGSGFLIDPRGLIATNHHVVQNTRFLAVQFPNLVSARAEIVSLSSRYDLAILKVHRKFVKGLPPLMFISQEKEDNIKPGLPVVAFGSPLGLTFLATQGIVSKVEERTLLGDFLLEPGNSGGPLVSLDGEVIGVNTFGVQSIGGAVRVSFLRRLLDELGEDQVTAVEVSDEPMRRLSEKRYPTELLKVKVLQGEPDSKEYQYNAGKFIVTVLTPVVIGKLATQNELLQAENRYKRRGRKIHDPSYRAMDELFYEWHRSAAPSLRMDVTIHVQPQVGQTFKSRFSQALAAGLSQVLAAGSGAYGIRGEYEFKGEFYRFEAYRDGQLIEPIRPGRYITENTLDGPLAKFIDEAYTGRYVYAPEDFMTGNEFRFVVYNAKKPEERHHQKLFKARSKLVKQIRSDFREAMGRAAEYWEKDFSPSAELPGTETLVVTGEAVGIVAEKGREGIDLLEVLVGSPAYEAGLRTGDTVLKINGRKVLRVDEGREIVSRDLIDVLKEIRKGKIQESKWTVQHRGLERTVRVRGESGSQ